MASSKNQSEAGAGRRRTGFESPVRELSDVARTRAARTAALTELGTKVEDAVKQNYGGALRQCLSRWEVREITREGKKRVWPALNRQPVTLVTLDEFVQRWSGFGVDFKFASLPWKRGLSLLGFYVKTMNREHKRPLIFVNTAHHPALVGAALDHEMGHHLTAQIFARKTGHTNMLSPTAFTEHLDEPSELAADILVSVGIFPAQLAKTLLEPMRCKAGSGPPGLSDPVFGNVLDYIAKRYDLRVESIRGSERKSQALAALVHYTKLRRALLDEYNT
ncbi:MAG TPA: hypothetical protein VJ728_13015 [Candidatus Binataceae bacterium]|nr:hypothetical protein [Candidatus Binataceae bacterium]